MKILSLFSFLEILFKLILAFLFYTALKKMPYSYYELLRLAALVFFVGIVVIDLRVKNFASLPIAMLGAILFNPFHKTFFPREVWQIIDKYIIGILLISVLLDLIIYSSKYIKNKQLIVIAAVLLSINSCKNGNTTRDEEDFNTNNEIKLSTKYSAITDWDEKAKYSVELQDLFQNKNVAFEGEIKDIVKKDSLYVLTVSNTNEEIFPCMAVVIIDSIQARKIITSTNANDNRNGVFILNIKSVSNANYAKIDSFDSGDEDSTTQEYINYNNEVTLLKGSMIEYYIEK